MSGKKKGLLSVGIVGAGLMIVGAYTVAKWAKEVLEDATDKADDLDNEEVSDLFGDAGDLEEEDVEIEDIDLGVFEDADEEEERDLDFGETDKKESKLADSLGL